MKTNRFKTFRGIALGLVLLVTALSFTTARAQSVAKTKDSKEITLTLEGTIRGGRFFFKENMIQFDTLNKYEWPQKDFSVDGKPWSELNKPFELDFTPDFAKAVILEKEGGPEGRTYVLPRENLFALMIVPDDEDAKEAPFRVKLAVKNQVPHDNLPPDETPVGKTARRATRRQATQSDSDDGEIRSITIVQTGTTAAERKTAATLNRKGFELFSLLSEKDENTNAFISPYSIDSAFGLVYCGAKDKTAEEIRTTLGLPDDPAACGKFFDKISREYAVNKQVEVLVSNSVWYEQDFEKDILPPFISMVKQYYGGTFYKEDFQKPEALVAKVNSYVEDRTKNMIRNLLSPADINPISFMILLNTLYFEARWQTPFEPEETRPMVFHNFDGWEKRVRMMHRRGFDIEYCSDVRDNVHAVILPYEDPRFELIALMPIQPGFDQGKAAMQDIISKIGTRLDSWLTNRSDLETLLWLPVTDLTCRYDLNDALGTLGMKTPFSMTQANFHGIAEPNDLLHFIWIDKVIHKTALKMDEESTKAAAATAITMAFGGAAAPREQPPVNVFRADRPFLVLIRDSRTGLILFAGRINDPGVEAQAQPEGFGFGGRRTPSFAPAPPNSDASPTDPAQGFNSFETWYAMMSNSAAHWDEPTDGQKHPQVYMTSGHDLSYLTRGRAPKGRERVKLTISAVVDRAARFEIIKNRIYYRPFQSNTLAGMSGTSQISSFEGYYPNSVTVNGKVWHNLRKPLELDFTPDLDALNGLSMNCGDISFSCRYGDETGNVSYSSRLVLEIRNNGANTSPAEIVLDTTALPNKDVKDPDDFEHNPFILRAVVEDEATFIFGKGMIRFVPGRGNMPTNVSVDGHSWDSLDKPFGLRKRLANPEIIEMKGRDTAKLTRKPSGTYSYRPGDEDEFELVIKDKYGYPSTDLYEIKIDSRKAEPVKNKSVSIMQRNSTPKDPADYEPGRFVLAGTFYGPANFVFEGNEVRYLHNTIQYPSGVSIDGKPWDDMKNPFRLDASPLGMAHPDIQEISGPYTAILRHVNDGRLEVAFELSTSSTGDPLRLTLASRKNPVQTPASGNGR